MPAWIRSTLEKEGHIMPHGTSKESKKPKSLFSYVALMTNLIDAKPSTYEATR